MNQPVRIPPALSQTNRAFWTAGERGQLLVHRCQDCGWWNHPPRPVCRRCLSDAVEPSPVSGAATVHTYTINRHQWAPGTDPVYVLAIVELAEQDGLRLTTNIVNCPPDEVRIGMPVRVCFMRLEDVTLPLFEPDDS